MSCFFVIGNDERTLNIKKMLKEEGKELTEKCKDANYIIAPTPLIKDNYIFRTNITLDEFSNMCKSKIVFAGAIKDDERKKLAINNIKYYDLMEYEDIAILNAIPTAEGAIEVAMQNSDITLCNSNVLILGYGRIGKILSKMLSGIGAKVYCEARKLKDLAQIKSMGYNDINLSKLNEYLMHFDYIFSTIPSLILNEDRLDLVKKNVCIVDLASKPGSVDYEYAKIKNINVLQALALPSKVAPKEAAKYMKNKIDEIILEIENVI